MPSQFPTLDRSPMLQVNIRRLIDDVQCYQTVRELRWPDGVTCPSCQSTQVIKRGFDDTEPARQRYECHDCETRFDDLTDTMFAGHHQPLKVWVLCLYFMGLHIPTVSLAVISLMASSCGYYRGANRAPRCALIRGARGDPERARETPTTLPSAMRAARRVHAVVPWQASTAALEEWHRSGTTPRAGTPRWLHTGGETTPSPYHSS